MSAATPSLGSTGPARRLRAGSPPASGASALVVAPVAAAGVAAALLGAATEAGQGVVPDGWGLLVNSVAAWVVLPAVLATAVLLATGWRGRRGLGLGLLTGVAACEALVVGYYGWAALVSGVPHAASSIAVWAVAAVPGGLLAGACASGWTARGHLRGAAVGLLAAVVLGDGLRALLVLDGLAASGWAFVIAALLVALAVPRRGERLACVLTLVCAVALAGGGYAVLDAVLTLAGDVSP